jgi:hypothetical protein
MSPRTGIAGTDHAGGLVGGDRVDGDPHRGAAQAQCGGRLHVVADHVGRVAHRAGAGGALAPAQERGDPRLIADQQEARLGMADRRQFEPIDDRLGRMVAAHRVHRQREALARQMLAHRASGPHVAIERQTRTAPFRALPAPMTSRPS